MTIFIFFIVLLFIASMLIDYSVNQKKQKSKKEIEWIDKFKLSKEYEEEMHEWLEEWDGYNSQKGYKENVNKFILEGYIKDDIKKERNIILSFKNPNSKQLKSENRQKTNNKKEDESYWSIVKRQFYKNKLAVWSLRFVYVIVFIGLFADFLANDKPLYCEYQGENYFPVFKSYAVKTGISKWPKELSNAYWKEMDYEKVIWPLIPYSAAEMDFSNSQYVGPFDEQNIKSKRWRHWLGTDELGRDVLSGLVHGTRIAMLVGIISMIIASFIGILLGSLAGFFGDNKLKVSIVRIIMNLICLFLGMFYAFTSRSFILGESIQQSYGDFFMQFGISVLIFTGIMLLGNLLVKPLKSINFLKIKRSIPVDIIICRLIEIFISIPKLLLILAIIAIVKPSILLVMVVIGATSWTGIARFIRGELLKVKNLEYIEAAKSLGYNNTRILLRHAIPNSLTPVLISIAFGIAGAILIESSLSFLGIGVPANTITWGKLLSFARQAPEAWWLAIFPGFAIFITITIFNLIGEGLTDAIDPRQKGK